MALSFEWHVVTGAAETLNPATGSSATNVNLMNEDAFDATGSDYLSGTNRISVPLSGEGFSYERWIKLRWSGSATSVTNVKIFKSAGTFSDASIVLNGGETDTYATPVRTESSIATASSTTWDTLAEAFDITPAAGLTSFPAFSDFFVMQLKVPDTVTTPGAIGSQTLSVQYDETP